MCFWHSQDKLTLPVVLNLYLGEFRHDQGVFLAGTALAMIPPAMLFFALQRNSQRPDLGRGQRIGMLFRNPIIPGFYPDPSLCRVGRDFYLVNTQLRVFPGRSHFSQSRSGALAGNLVMCWRVEASLN